MPFCAYDEPPTWNSGIATMFLSSGPNSKVPALIVCANRFRCVNVTPLGWPVVPDEYMISAASSGVTSGWRPIGVAAASIASYSSSGPPSGVTSMTCSTWVSWPRIFSMPGMSSAPTTSSLAPQSLRT